MKKVLLSAATFVLALGASAQFDAGSILLSGASSLNFSSGTSTYELDGESSDDETKVSNFGLGTSVGYFVADGLAVGLMIDFDSAKDTYVPDEGDELADKTSSVAVGPMVRYYIGDSGLFGQGYLTFGSQTNTYDYIDWETGDIEEEEDKASLMNLGIGVGYAIPLNDNLYIEPMLSYGTMRATSEVETINEDFEEVTVDGISKTGGINFSIAVTGILN